MAHEISKKYILENVIRHGTKNQKSTYVVNQPPAPNTNNKTGHNVSKKFTTSILRYFCDSILIIYSL